MATNKNALIRYKTLDKCFRNTGKRYFLEDLIKECEKVLLSIDSQSNGISRRQILNDIAFMESKAGWGDQLELDRIRDGHRVYYRYKNPDFSINNMPLNEIEINHLQSAADILTQFKGMPQFEWLNELIPKLQQGIVAKEKPSTIIEFDSNEYLKGIEYLGPLHNAIFYKRVLNIEYKSFKSEKPHFFLIHPYFLRQYNNRWFLFGYNPEQKKYDWNLAIDRIVSIKETKDKYHRNSRINWQEYFEDIIGVTKTEDAEVSDVTLLFYGTTGKYIETKPLHGSQRCKWIDDSILKVDLKLIINYELERLILSYADSVKVLAPSSLAHTVRTRLSNALEIQRAEIKKPFS